MRIKFKFIILIFIVCLIGAFLLSSPLFSIKDINTIGNKVISKDAIIRLSGLSFGENIFRINKMRVMKNIFQDPHIEKIKIRRALPNTVIIDIIEREAIALVPYVGSYLNIDGNGMVIEINPSINKANLPVINGLKFDTFKLGESLNIKNAEQFSITKTMITAVKKTDFISQIAFIDVTDTENMMLLTTTGVKINFGGNKNVIDKMTFAKAIVEDVNKKQLKGTIDMSHEGNPVFKPES